MKHVLAIAIFGLISSFNVMGDNKKEQWAPIEDRLSAKEFMEMGLHKISPKELKRLNNWLKAEEKEVIISTPPSVRNAIESQPREMRIAGTFKGWTGKTVFKMDNGEIWIQRSPGRYTKKLESPQVIINKNSLGFFVMTVAETGKSIGVSRYRKKRK
ncbi:hypothetical protein KFE80_09125 [bacterium SCSIO 12696]|nr:hypothetical protein KFE80_09125 [bacterium SCSIO 12696]